MISIHWACPCPNCGHLIEFEWFEADSVPPLCTCSRCSHEFEPIEPCLVEGAMPRNNPNTIIDNFFRFEKEESECPEWEETRENERIMKKTLCTHPRTVIQQDEFLKEIFWCKCLACGLVWQFSFHQRSPNSLNSKGNYNEQN